MKSKKTINLMLCDITGRLIDDLSVEELGYNFKPFLSTQNLKIVDRPRDADYIVPKVDLDYNWMRSASRNFRKLTRGKLYRKFGEKFVFYNLHDIPEYLHQDDVGLKFAAMPMYSHAENIKCNVNMVPLLNEMYFFEDANVIDELRNTKREYEYSFVGAISSGGPRSVRTQRDFIYDFVDHEDSLIIDTTNEKSIFHVKKDWKIYAFLRKYFERLSLSRFGFCPVGQGLNSFRIGECMRIGVVPIIVGHKCLPLEQFINWEECCLIFDDTEDVSHDTIKQKMENKDYAQMSKMCIEVWEQYFRPENLYQFLFEEFLLK
jgi:hypothetical protein